MNNVVKVNSKLQKAGVYEPLHCGEAKPLSEYIYAMIPCIQKLRHPVL